MGTLGGGGVGGQGKKMVGGSVSGIPGRGTSCRSTLNGEVTCSLRSWRGPVWWVCRSRWGEVKADAREESKVGPLGPWGCTEDFGFYPEGPSKPLWGFKQRSSMIRFAFSEDFSAAMWRMDLRVGGEGGSQTS